jgi:hypothetical protein
VGNLQRDTERQWIIAVLKAVPNFSISQDETFSFEFPSFATSNLSACGS